MSYSSITSNFVSNYANHLSHLKKQIDAYCSENESIGKIVNLMYSDYEKDSFDWHMQKALWNILRDINVDMELEEDDYDWGYSHHNVLENLEKFIVRYMHIDSIGENCISYGLKFEFLHNDDGNIVLKVDEEEFDSEHEMNEHGFTNRSEDILAVLEEYVKAQDMSKK